MAQFNYEGNVYACVGRFLKRELKKGGIDQLDFAEEVGCNERTVRRWIYGEVHSLDVVVLVAEYFGVSVGDVLSDEDGRPFLCKKIKRFRPDISCPIGISYSMLESLSLSKYDVH